MKYFQIFVLTTLSLDCFGLTIIPPTKIHYMEARKYGIEIDRRIDDKESVIYLNIDELKFCKVKSVEVLEKLDTVGEDQRFISKGYKGYSAVFNNESVYEYIAFLIKCNEWPKQFDNSQFLVVIE